MQKHEERKETEELIDNLTICNAFNHFIVAELCIKYTRSVDNDIRCLLEKVAFEASRRQFSIQFVSR